MLHGMSPQPAPVNFEGIMNNYKCLLFVLLALLPAFAPAQTVTPVAAPQLIPVPTTFGKGLNNSDGGPQVSFSADGQYLMANTQTEAKVWHLPDGEMIYRFNIALMVGEDPKRQLLNYRAGPPVITTDGKYLYTYGGTGQDYGMMPMEMETGTMLRKGLTRDSIRNGSYQYARELINSHEAKIKMLQQFHRLKINGADDFEDEDALNVQSMVASTAYPGQVIVAFWRGFAGSKSFITSNLKESVKQVREVQKRSTANRFYELHAARYNPATNTPVYMGKVLNRIVALDVFNRDFYAALSPVDDIAYLQYTSSPQRKAFSLGPVGSPTVATINDLNGTPLWVPSATGAGALAFKGFDAFGFPFFDEMKDDKVLSRQVFEPLTGKLLYKYLFSAALSPRYRYNLQWNVVVAVEQLEDKNWTVALYDGTTGKHLLSLPDEQEARNASAATDAENKRQNDYVNAYQKAMRESWDRQQAQYAREAREEQEKKRVDAIAHAKIFRPCDLCSGTGVWVQSGYVNASRKTSYSKGRSSDGSRATIVTTVSNPGGRWEQRGPCLRCNGRGEVRR